MENMNVKWYCNTHPSTNTTDIVQNTSQAHKLMQAHANRWHKTESLWQNFTVEETQKIQEYQKHLNFTFQHSQYPTRQHLSGSNKFCKMLTSGTYVQLSKSWTYLLTYLLKSTSSKSKWLTVCLLSCARQHVQKTLCRRILWVLRRGSVLPAKNKVTINLWPIKRLLHYSGACFTCVLCARKQQLLCRRELAIYVCA